MDFGRENLKKLGVVLVSLAGIYFSALFLREQVKPYRLITAIPETHPLRKNYEKFVTQYDDENKLFVGLDFSGPTPAMDMAQAIRILKSLNADFLTVRFVDDVHDLSNARFPFRKGSHFQLQPLVDARGEISPANLIILDTPPFLNNFVTLDRSAYLMTVVFKKEMPREYSGRILKELISILDGVKAKNNIQYYFLGDLYQQNQFQVEIGKGNLQVMPVFIAIIILSFYFFFRSWGVAFSALFIIGISYFVTVLFIAWWENSLGPLSSMALFFVFVVATSDLIHFYTALKRGGMGATSEILRPCLMTSLTTFLGFGSLIFSELTPLRDFGLYTCVGIGVAFLSTFYFLPGLIRIFNVHVPPEKGNRHLVAPFKIFSMVRGHKFKIMGLYLFAGLFALSYVKDLKFQDSFLEMFVDSHPLSKSVKFFQQKFQMSGSLELILHGQDEDLADMQNHEGLLQFAQDIEALNNVATLTSIHGLRHLLGGQDKAAASFQAMRESGIFKNFLPLLKGQSRFIVKLRSMNSDALLETSKEIAALFEASQLKQKFKMEVTGYSQVRMGISKMIFHEFLESIIMTVLAIFLAFIIYYRSLKIAAWAILPNLFPVIVMFGLIAYFKIPIDFNLVVLNSAILGIGVDDTIHFLHFYFKNHKFKEANNRVRRSLLEAYHPITQSTYLFLMAFPAFWITDFRIFHKVAFFLMSGLFLALLADIIFNPAFLLWMSEREGKK